MDGCIREMKVRVRDLGARLNVRGVEEPVVASLYVDDTVLLAESEGMLQEIVDEFDRVCKKRKLKVILGCKIWMGTKTREGKTRTWRRKRRRTRTKTREEKTRTWRRKKEEDGEEDEGREDKDLEKKKEEDEDEDEGRETERRE